MTADKPSRQQLSGTGCPIRLDGTKLDGRALARARRRARLTQQQLADRIGVTNMAISLIELGKNRPAHDTLARIADALGYDLALIPKEGSE